MATECEALEWSAVGTLNNCFVGGDWNLLGSQSMFRSLAKERAAELGEVRPNGETWKDQLAQGDCER